MSDSEKKGHFEGRDIVSIDHFTTDEIEYLVDKAAQFKKNPSKMKGSLKGKGLTFAFFEPSTRTRISFLKAAQNLGMERNGFGSAESSSLTKGESIYHTLKMLEGYGHDVLVLRHKLDGAAQYAADKLGIPVVNAGDGKHEHPTQTLLDLFTIRETQGSLGCLKVALVGDLKYGRTVHSLVKALRQFPNNTFSLVNTPSLALPEEYTHYEDASGKHLRKDIEQNVSLEQALKTCDIIYMTRTQLERMDPEERSAAGAIKLGPEKLTGVKKNLKILHPLPIDANHGEIHKAFDRINPEYAYFFQQAANGIPMREA